MYGIVRFDVHCILGDKNDAKDGKEKLLNLSRSLDETCLLSYLLSRKAKLYGMVKEWNSTTPLTILELADIPPNLASTEVHMFHVNLLHLDPVKCYFSLNCSFLFCLKF